MGVLLDPQALSFETFLDVSPGDVTVLSFVLTAVLVQETIIRENVDELELVTLTWENFEVGMRMRISGKTKNVNTANWETLF